MTTEVAHKECLEELVCSVYNDDIGLSDEMTTYLLGGKGGGRVRMFLKLLVKANKIDLGQHEINNFKDTIEFLKGEVEAIQEAGEIIIPPMAVVPGTSVAQVGVEPHVNVDETGDEQWKQGEEAMIESPLRHAKSGGFYTEVMFPETAIIVKGRGIYILPKTGEHKSQRIFYRGELVRYRQIPKAKEHVGYLCGLDKESNNCKVKIVKQENGIVFNIEPLLVSKYAAINLRTKLPMSMKQVAQAARACGCKIELDKLFEDYDPDSYKLKSDESDSQSGAGETK